MRDQGTTHASVVAGELRVVLGQLVRRLREQADGTDLTRSQASVLGRIDRDGPTTATVLARTEGLRPQSMGTIVAALEAAGLVAGSPDPKDGRKTILSLTQTAREQFRTGRLAREDWLIQAMSAALTQSELDQLSSSIDLLRRIARS
jgi:DNA-binding MarR family transcriptional regulator